jgi:hypothetical protein
MTPSCWRRPGVATPTPPQRKQGGTWSVRTTGGPIDGVAFTIPEHGHITRRSLVATIDAGTVGCPALSP